MKMETTNRKTEGPVAELMSAYVEQTYKDLVFDYKRLKKNPDDSVARNDMQNCERVLREDMPFRHVDGQKIIEQARQVAYGGKRKKKSAR